MLRDWRLYPFLVGMEWFCHHGKQFVLLKKFTKSFIRPQILPLGMYRKGFQTGAVYVPAYACQQQHGSQSIDTVRLSAGACIKYHLI